MSKCQIYQNFSVFLQQSYQKHAALQSIFSLCIKINGTLLQTIDESQSPTRKQGATKIQVYQKGHV